MSLKVSVILPSLNVAGYIREAVWSVQQQTMKELEIICIDAGSTDGTWEILSELAKHDDRILLIHSDRKSYGYQVNIGIKMARGEYLAIVETDDYIDSQMYDQLYQAAVSDDCDYIKCDYQAYWTQRNGERFFINRRVLSEPQLYYHAINPINYSQLAQEDWYIWNGLYKTDFIKRNAIYCSETAGAAFQDIGFLYQVNINAKRALYVQGGYYKYCVDREDSSTNTGNNLRFSYQEFHRIKELEIYKRNLQSIQALYIRMARSFNCCYGKYITEEDENWQYYLWLQKEIRYAIEHGYIHKKILQAGIWKKLQIMLYDEYQTVIQQEQQNLEAFLGFPSKYPIILFGCGYFGYEAYRYLCQQGYPIAAFMDNDARLWESAIDDISVVSPAAAKDYAGDTRYIIANETYYDQIREQLLGYGIAADRIYVYN